MDKFFVLMEPKVVEFLFDEVFDGFDIVVGDFLDVFDFLGIFDSEVAVDFAQVFEEVVVEAYELWQGYLAQGDEVFDFDCHTVADERALGEVVGKVFDFVTVSPVNGGDGC